MYKFPLDAALAARLVERHFPQWAGLPIRPMQPMGHDNRTFRLGDTLTVRLPSDPEYVSHIPTEIYCLQTLQPYLDVRIPVCVASVEPDDLFPAPWTVNAYLPGETVTRRNVPESAEVHLARDVRHALAQLQAAPVSPIAAAGKANFYRGCPPEVYAGETYAALERWRGSLPVEAMARLWEEAVAARYSGPPVWLHGDVAVGNMLVREGRLFALIDFGTSGVGDPACDYVLAWTFLGPEARREFLAGLDEGMILRAKAWALWKSLICYDGDPAGEHGRVLRAVMEP